METLKLIPRGDVSKQYDFGINKVEFESGVQEYQRKWQKPRIVLSFSVTGDKSMKEYLEGFIVARGGSYEPFLWSYEGKDLRVRFSESSINITELRGYEGTGTVGYKADISLTVLKDSER